MSPAPHPPGLPRAAVDALLLDTTPWLSCEECFDRLDTYAEAVVDDPAFEDLAMGRHLRGCAACAEEAAALVELVGRDDRQGPASRM